MFPSSYFPSTVFPTAYFVGGSGTGGGGGGEGGGGAGGTVVRIISPTIAPCCQQTVYLRARWYDQWQEADIWCESADWTVAPTIPTAELRFRYGHMLLPGSAGFAPRFRIERPRYYVKIVFESAEDESPWTREWYGVIELEIEDIQGPRLVNENGQTFYRTTGINKFVAYGLESLLDSSHIITSRGGAGAGIVQRAITFNHNISKGLKEGNKSPGGGPGGTPVFHDEKTGGSEWTTLDICKYLLKYHTPRKSPDAVDLPFELAAGADNILPSFDRPEVPAEGKTARDILNSLVARQRLLGWYATVDGNEVQIVPFSYTGENIALGSQSPFAYYTANPNKKIIATEKDRTCALIVKRSTADQFDRVVVRGARRTSTGSFSFTEGTLTKGWPGALETAYEAGASGAGDYPPAGDIEERYYRNMQARKAPKFKSVYSRFIIPEDFGGYVGDGEGIANHVFMPSDQDEDTPANMAPEDLAFRKTMPLLDGYDYSGDITLGGSRVSDGPHEELPPLVLFQRYDWEAGNRVYRPAEGLAITSELADAGINEDELWSARVGVADDGALLLEVDGEQHWIAKTDFTRLADLDPEPFADFRDMIVTASVEWSQFTESAYPEEIPFQVDAPRELLILAGETFRCDYIAPETVVAINAEDGTLERCDGGYVQDDRAELETIARQSYEWYNLTRKAITLETKIVNSELQLGDFIVSLGDPDFTGDIQTEDINSVITSIRLTMQLLESPAESGGVPPPPVIRYETGYGELDPLAFVRGE